jgi:hypothetical protein
MRFYVPVGPHGILFRLGMTWTRLLGGLTYWSAHHRAQKSPSLGLYPSLYSPGGQPPHPRSDSSLTSKIGRCSTSAETAADPLRAILQYDFAHSGKIEGVTDQLATPDELERIHEACANVNADAEITELVLASHRRDRAKLEAMLNAGKTVDEYVQHKLAIWEAILNEDNEPRSFHRSPSRNASSDTP